MNLMLQPVLLGSVWILTWERELVCPVITDYSEPSMRLVSTSCSINTISVEYLVQQECYVGHYNFKNTFLAVSPLILSIATARSIFRVMLAAVSYRPQNV